ncbi:MAG TPA: MMPL family transporter [Gemmatimonadaceae bacterium]|nr:MMPL family transporter [Gemmatimonadaceae bacterium]
MTLTRRFASIVVDYRKWVIGFWVILAAVLMPMASKVEQRLEVAATIKGSESARVEKLLAERFTSGIAQYAVLVMSGAPDPRTARGIEFLKTVRDKLETQPFVSGTFSYLDAPDTLFVGKAGTTFMVVGLKPGTERPDKLIPRLRNLTAETDGARYQVTGNRELLPDHGDPAPGNVRFPSYGRVTYTWTGEIALNHDLRLASASDAQNAEKRVLPITLLLLVVAFGAVAASLLPLVAGGFAISLALGAAVVISARFPLSILLQNVVTMLGLGLGIDYALLVVGRFREGLFSGLPSRDAAIDAGDQAGHTIILSGASVCIGFAALTVIPVNELKSLAVGGLLVILMAVLLAVTLLPAMLAVLGHKVNWLRVRRKDAGTGSERWRRWGRFVCAHPVMVLIVAGIPITALALQATRLNTDLPRGDWLPAKMESAVGLRTLRDSQRSGIVNAIRIVVQLPEDSPWDSPSGWQALKRAGDRFAIDKRVARVRSLPSVTGLVSPNLQVLMAMPASLRGALASNDGHSALIELMPTEDASQHGAMDLVREIRSRSPESITGLAGVKLDVGGLPALNVDYAAATTGRFWNVVLYVVVVTMVALLIGFRSALIALKAVALNLLSVAAAFGAVVLVFQDGVGIRLLGLSAPLDGTFSAIPLMVFCVVFGLSMDYEVFLVARVAEARRSGADDSEAIAEGLAKTGGLITSAAAIMIVVFAGFTLGDFVIVKILGFALAVAVLIDATIVRVAIGPALFKLAGRWNWWPGERSSRTLVEEGRAKGDRHSYAA